LKVQEYIRVKVKRKRASLPVSWGWRTGVSRAGGRVGDPPPLPQYCPPRDTPGDEFLFYKYWLLQWQ
jgi:hypothetical protein